MKNTNNILTITLVAVIILLSWGLTENYNKYNASILEKKSCKEDSLRNVIDSLNTELEILNDGFHYKEQRYEEIIYEFEQKYKQKVPPGKYSPVN